MSAGDNRAFDTLYTLDALNRRFRASDADPKEVFVPHGAGLGGYAGSSYIDGVILRDRDANSGWTSAADSTREERRSGCACPSLGSERSM